MIRDESFLNSPYKNCVLCPRRCAVNREAGLKGFCGETAEMRLVFAGIHRGEEPGITGDGGSGTMFFSGCNLGCIFCQNFQISHRDLGRVITVEEFAEICLSLQEKEAENINIVTGGHLAPLIALGIEAARKQGLFVPVVWNSSAYEGAQALEILKDFVDVYMPDLKTLDTEMGGKFFGASDYPEHATKAIQKMMEFRKLRFGPGREEGMDVMVSGVMIRHLVIPGYLENTRQVLRWFAENCKGQNKALLSLMTQYTPVRASGVEVPGRYLLPSEYEAVFLMLNELGINDGYCQELVTGSDWLPDFNRQNPFSSKLSKPVWHLNSGVISGPGQSE